MRRGRTFKRCQSCSRPAEGRRCERCGSDRITWAAQFDVHEKDQPRRQVLRSGFATKAEAVRAIAEHQQRAESGSPEPSRRTVGQWLDEWVPSMRGQVRGGTFAQYELAARHYVKPRIGDVPLRKLTKARLRAMYADLAEKGNRTGGPLARKSVHNIALVVHRALEDAVEENLLPRNVADDSHSLPRNSRSAVTAWHADEVAAFLAQVREDRLYAMWRLAFTSGMRRGELLGLRWRDVDLDAAHFSVSRARVRGVDGLGWDAPKTGSANRRVTLDAGTVATLREHRARQNKERLAIGPGWADEDLVFCRADGTPLSLDAVTAAFSRLVARSGLPRITLHGARHTAASVLLAAGVHPKAVQARLGHSSIQVTMDLYSHLTPAVEEDAAERLARAIDG